MIGVKGKYEWELKDIDGNIMDIGTQWNTISDSLLKYICETAAPGDLLYNIQLSDTIPTPGVEYRAAGASNGFSVLTSSGVMSTTDNTTTQSTYVQYNFPPPASPRTINTIGVNAAGQNFCSFIELSSPITQQTNQYLFVKYTIFYFYTGGGLNAPDNRYLEYYMNSGILQGVTLHFGKDTYYKYAITSCLPPSDINKLMRMPRILYSGSDIASPYGSVYAQFSDHSFGVSELVGPVGSVVFASERSSPFLRHCFGWSPQDNFEPSISAVFPHPYNRYNSPFSDPAYPASSQGSVSVSGTPTNKFQMIGRIEITKTGDASDIVDEDFATTDIDTSTDQITLTQSFAIDDIVQFSTTGTLPSPLVDSTDYYIVSELTDESFAPAAVNTGTDVITVTQSFHVNDIVRFTTTGTLPDPLVSATDYYVVQGGTDIKISTARSGGAIDITTQGSGTHTVTIESIPIIKVSASQSGGAIDITTQGSGTHTIKRQNTGEFCLSPVPYADRDYPFDSNVYDNLNMGVDVDGHAQPAYLENANDDGEGGDNPGGYANTQCRGYAKIGDYLYTCQQSYVSQKLTMCRWLFNSIETSESLVDFGSASLEFRKMESDGTKLYIATGDSGIYVYDTTAPTVAPSLETITGAIDQDFQDIAYDEITGYLWGGHLTGLSKIDVSTFTATQYIAGTGEQLEGMSSNELHIQTGQLEAYNGRVLRAGCHSEALGYGTSWVMDDAAHPNATYRVFLSNTIDGSLKRGTTEVCARTNRNIYLYDVTPTGKNTGGSVQLNTAEILEVYTSSYNQCVFGMVEIYPGAWVFGYPRYLTKVRDAVGVYYGGTSISRGFFTDASSPTRNGWRWAQTKNARNIDIGNGLFLIPCDNRLFYSSTYSMRPKFGWNGSSWEMGHEGRIKIPKTGAVALLDGISATFNNSTGSSWDQQFIENENFSFVYGCTPIKTNLQTARIRARFYYGEAVVRESRSLVIPGSPYQHTIDEVSNPDFRDMDTRSIVTFVWYPAGGRYFTSGNPANPEYFSVTTSGIFEFNPSDAGKTVELTYTYTLYS